MLNEGNQTHIFISISGSGTVINYGSGSDFLTSYGSGSGSTTLLVTLPRDCCSVPPPPVPLLPVPVPAPPALAPSSSPVVPGNVASPKPNGIFRIFQNCIFNNKITLFPISSFYPEL
jgi:hypothetical protein